ncbi:MAG: hypothetical protein AAGG46_12590 [Planctomycetota bacterium]
MSQPRGVLVKKPRTNIYTVLLIIAFVAMCIGCLFLYLEAALYDRAPNARLAPALGPTRPAAAQLAATHPAEPHPAEPHSAEPHPAETDAIGPSALV